MFQRIPLFGACEVTSWGRPSQGDLKGHGVPACLWKAWKELWGRGDSLKRLGAGVNHPLFSREVRETTYGTWGSELSSLPTHRSSWKALLKPQVEDALRYCSENTSRACEKWFQNKKESADHLCKVFPHSCFPYLSAPKVLFLFSVPLGFPSCPIQEFCRGTNPWSSTAPGSLHVFLDSI